MDFAKLIPIVAVSREAVVADQRSISTEHPHTRTPAHHHLGEVRDMQVIVRSISCYQRRIVNNTS